MGLPTVTLAGYLARDPEMRYTQGGTAVANTSIPANYQERAAEGQEPVDRVDWYNITAWGNLAESLNQHGRKGRFVSIVGHQKIDQYTTREGERRVNISVTVRDISWGPRLPEQGAAQGGYNAPQGGYSPQSQGGYAPAAQGYAAAPPAEDDDLPW